MKNKKHEILLGLTTTPKSDWRNKVEEMKKFGIKKIALFPTFLEIDQRKELYGLLEAIDDLEIPHVHLRDQDMEEWELDWFKARGASNFNIHMGGLHNPILKQYSENIFIENHIFDSISLEELESCGGICIDFQHLEITKKKFPHVAEDIETCMDKFPVGCCHIAPLPKIKNIFHRFINNAWVHYMISIDELDYVEKYREYLPYYVSIELENSFEVQLKAKAHLERILDS